LLTILLRFGFYIKLQQAGHQGVQAAAHPLAVLMPPAPAAQLLLLPCQMPVSRNSSSRIRRTKAQQLVQQRQLHRRLGTQMQQLSQ
jgi:hypothetical protein